MEPLYFGDTQQPLFGLRHAAQGSARRSAVLICPSWGMEHLRAYRGLRQLAQMLAARGYEVLRFDYSGTGDSLSDSSSVSWERWQADCVSAANELRSLSGAQRICLLGLRLGALLAAASVRAAAAQDLVLWDAPASGAQFIEEMRALEISLEAERKRQRTASARLKPPAADELLGHLWPATLDRALREVTLNTQQPALHLSSADQADVPGALRLPDAALWQIRQRLSTPWLPQASLRRTVEEICTRLP